MEVRVGPSGHVAEEAFCLKFAHEFQTAGGQQSTQIHFENGQ